MTPQTELTRLLGIPQELWAGELSGMSDEMLRGVTREILNLNNMAELINREQVHRHVERMMAEQLANLRARRENDQN